MSGLEEHTLESLQVVLENGGPTLCAIHADDVVDVSEDPAVDPDAA